MRISFITSGFAYNIQVGEWHEIIHIFNDRMWLKPNKFDETLILDLSKQKKSRNCAVVSIRKK